MVVPTWVLVIIGFFLVGAAGGVGLFIGYYKSMREGTFCLWIEKLGVNRAVRKMFLRYDYDTNTCLFPTQNVGRWQVDVIGNFNRVIHTTTLAKDDVIELDASTVLVGVKELNAHFHTEIENRDEKILDLQGKVDELRAENAELNLLADKLDLKRNEQSKDRVIVPYIPGKTRSKN